MIRSDKEKEGRKEAMKRLRMERREMISSASRKALEQKKAIEAVKNDLEGGGKSVPELAAGIGMSPSEVLWYIATLRKYGQIAEGEKKSGYFQYLWVGGASDDARDSDREAPL